MVNSLNGYIILAGIVLFLSSGCKTEAERSGSVDRSTLFALLPASYTNIAFQNTLTDTEDFNVFKYRNYYDGGGVGLGDFNQDGWLDVYLTANQTDNRLYLNKGDFWFEDATRASGAGGRRKWSTGVAVADVNGDGLLDIYVCNSGDVKGDSRANELFINQGNRQDGTPYFEDQAEDFGLADTGYATHASFFDFDHDGDLDMYLMNNTSRPISSFTERQIRDVRHEKGGDKLFRNDDGFFVDVSESAGVWGSEIGFGLAVTTGDVNNDGWQDIYISNDFFERDYLYINQRDGTFLEELEAWMPYISQSSMGADIADINNDGYLDIYVTDMLPEDDTRLKTTSTFDAWEPYQNGLAEGFYHQLMRNMLHINNQNNTFSEVGLMAGVAETDWSWSALIADYDLDGLSDIYVTNGIYKDLTDQDFITFFGSEETTRQWITGDDISFLKLLDEIPSTPLPNYLFARRSDGRFINKAGEWGIETSGFSNGAGYGDLDNDGDLDLVVNNVNMDAFVYMNQADSFTENGYLQVELSGSSSNRKGLGARVTLYAEGKIFAQEMLPTRGFQSSVEPMLTFGLGEVTQVDSLHVRWPLGNEQWLRNLEANQRIMLEEADAALAMSNEITAPSVLFKDISASFSPEIRHVENTFSDFTRQPLAPKMVSAEGPRIAVGDVNRDGLDDFFLGGAKESPGQVWVQQRNGGYALSSEAVFSRDAIAEDLDAAFFDADRDGDLDLLVTSGGSEFAAMAPALQDRLYLNNGAGEFTKSSGRLPPLYSSNGTVEPFDYDGDGDLDLFLGSRVSLRGYGFSTSSFLLQNDGRGTFKDVTAKVAPVLQDAGMVTDAVAHDFTRDGLVDLLISYEWGPIQLLKNDNGASMNPGDAGLGKSNGLWNRLYVVDIDSDGDLDVIAGNIGNNTKITASEEHPATLHVDDFDNNGTPDHFLSLHNGEKSLPLLLKRDLVRAMPLMEQQIESHSAYAGQSLRELFSGEQFDRAHDNYVYRTESVVMINDGNGNFMLSSLPQSAQQTPVYAMLADDFDQDEQLDLVLGGNFSFVKPDLGRMYGFEGMYLKGGSNGGFEADQTYRYGFFVRGDVRDIARLTDNRFGDIVLVAVNNGPVRALQVIDK